MCALENSVKHITIFSLCYVYYTISYIIYILYKNIYCICVRYIVVNGVVCLA